jgi:hypothetical protein
MSVKSIASLCFICFPAKLTGSEVLNGRYFRKKETWKEILT